jgi:hypothetical protein
MMIFVRLQVMDIDELIGQPHNIIRHKDMPKVAFKDLWETVKKGNIWTGYVKNRAKNGDFYWVYATVYPTVTSENTKGFLSCRRKASAEEIQAHENLYKQLRMSEKAA